MNYRTNNNPEYKREVPRASLRDRDIELGGPSIRYVHLHELKQEAPQRNNPPIYLTKYIARQREIAGLNLLHTDYRKLSKILYSISQRDGKDISTITVPEALRWVGKIVGEKITYNWQSADLALSGELLLAKLDKGEFSSSPTKSAELRNKKREDMVPIDILMERGGTGICVNYTRAFTACMEALKILQEEKGGTSLQNTYYIPSGTQNHDLVTVFSVRNGGNLEATIIDPTAMDVDLIGKIERSTPSIENSIQTQTPEIIAQVLADVFRILGSPKDSEPQTRGVIAWVRAKVVGMIGRGSRDPVSDARLAFLSSPVNISRYLDQENTSIATRYNPKV